MLKLKIKKIHPDAKIPKYAKPGDSGLDLVAVDRQIEGDLVIYSLGLGFEIPEGYGGFVFPRSSIKNYDLELTNSVGLIDSGYRGEVKVVFRITNSQCKIYEIGERVAQLVLIATPHVELIESNTLTDSERGSGGFGSSGR